MKTEELEQSLRAEFEEQLKNAIAKMRSAVADLQKNYEDEFEKHRSQMDEAFRAFSSRMDAPLEFDAAFTGSIVEHLRLARDEGARITATAMGEAEKLAVSGSEHDLGILRDAISEIKRNFTQAAILNSLIDAAANFARRGAFFIVKNDHLVGWRAFNESGSVEDDVVRGIHFKVGSDDLASGAIAGLSTIKGSNDGQFDNSKFLSPLSFDSPNTMFAVPLCARGRGVAVLYVDGGEADAPVNLDALETLVSVAELRVELLAASAASSPDETRPEELRRSEADHQERSTGHGTEISGPDAHPTDPKDEVEYAGEIAVASIEEPVAGSEIQVSDGSPGTETGATTDYAINHDGYSEDEPDMTPNEADESGEASQPRSYREKTVDLPIEVSEVERRPHSDARRFARLLVSEIKLYNEQKVLEGRESGDIYEVLKEAIDRSREMYEKRVQPDVAAKFDYFHYELVNTLAGGDEEKLGSGYLAVRA